ncbi:MAG: YbhB/YbcL family Raf kinase inhibitor-like protein, partial [Gammaproteobacteria bacterium]
FKGRAPSRPAFEGSYSSGARPKATRSHFMLEKLPPVLGHALRNQRAGLEKIAFHQIDLRNGTAQIEVRSLAFADHAPIPEQYTADGEAISPPLNWSGVPESATSLLLIVEDADAPTPSPLVHAIVVDLDATRNELPEGALKSPRHDGSGLETGKNSFLQQAWLPPDPPPGHGPHRYAFQVFALADGAAFSDAPGRDEVLSALRERAVASGCLIGTYERDTTVKVDSAEAIGVVAAT